VPACRPATRLAFLQAAVAGAGKQLAAVLAQILLIALIQAYRKVTDRPAGNAGREVGQRGAGHCRFSRRDLAHRMFGSMRDGTGNHPRKGVCMTVAPIAPAGARAPCMTSGWLHGGAIVACAAQPG